MDTFFCSNLRKMKRGVRKLRKDSLLSNFSSHVVFGQQKILGKICSLTEILTERPRFILNVQRNSEYGSCDNISSYNPNIQFQNLRKWSDEGHSLEVWLRIFGAKKCFIWFRISSKSVEKCYYSYMFRLQ